MSDAVEIVESQEPLDVVGVGACNADLFVYLKAMPAVGATVYGERYEEGCGGKNHNQVLQAAQIDPAAQKTIDRLSEEAAAKLSDESEQASTRT